MELHVCGSRGTCPVSGPQYREFGGATTCYVLRQGDYALVLDCGSGLQRAGSILAPCRRIDVLLTHLHYDHLIGLLASSVFPPDARLRFFSRFDDWFGQDTLHRFLSPPFWPWMPDLGTLHSVHPPERLSLEEGICVDFIDSIHPDECLLVRLHAGGKRICLAWDYEHGQRSLDDWAQNCDLLLYDGTFAPEEYPDHEGWGHSTWREGCALAKRSGTARLVISHHSPDADDNMLRRAEAEAMRVFPHTHFAREGEIITL